MGILSRIKNEIKNVVSEVRNVFKKSKTESVKPQPIKPYEPDIKDLPSVDEMLRTMSDYIRPSPRNSPDTRPNGKPDTLDNRTIDDSNVPDFLFKKETKPNNNEGYQQFLKAIAESKKRK